MKPRYRKPKLEIRHFTDDYERDNYIRDFENAEQKIFSQIKENLIPQGFTAVTNGTISAKRVEILQVILSKIEKFCPHFTTTLPTFRHMLLPAIGVGCCNECLIDFMPMLVSNTSGCDLCGVGKEKDMYIEITYQLGFGTLTMNLGAECCAEIFIKRT